MVKGFFLIPRYFPYPFQPLLRSLQSWKKVLGQFYSSNAFW